MSLEEALLRSGLTDPELFGNINRREIGYVENLLRRERYHFQGLILQGKIEVVGKNYRG